MDIHFQMSHRDQPVRIFLNGNLAAEVIASNCCETVPNWEKELREARSAVSFLKWAREAMQLLKGSSLNPGPFLRGLEQKPSSSLATSFPGVEYSGDLDYRPNSPEAISYKLGAAMARALGEPC